MLTSKERAELRSKATALDTTLMVGKGGVTEAVIAEADNQLTTRELVKGKVLEGAMMTPREVCDEICEATGADGVAVIGTKFVIYRFSEKLQQERNQVGRAKRKEPKINPVRKGAQARRQAQFVCVITLITPEGEIIQARGEAHGMLLREPVGTAGFGYDPIFYYPPLGKTTAELSPEEKNEVSHRANALKVFYEKLKEAGYADK